MSKKLDKFDFEEAKRNRAKRPSPFDKYLDGNIWELTMEDAGNMEEELNFVRGTVYYEPADFVAALRVRAQRLKMTLTSFSDKTEGKCVVQAFPKQEKPHVLPN